MKLIEAKFQPIQQIEWAKYFEKLPRERQINSFPEFLKWLEEEGNVWAAIKAKSLSPAGKSSKPSTTLYSGTGNKSTIKLVGMWE